MTVPDDGKTYGRQPAGWQPVAAANPVTGDVTINSTDGYNLILNTVPPGNWPGIQMNMAPTGGAWIGAVRSGNWRWEIDLGNGATETGSNNVGSDFQINRYSDTGVYLSSAIVITRTDGHVYMAGGISMGSVVAPGGPTDLSQHLAIWSNTYGMSVTPSQLNIVTGGQVGLSINNSSFDSVFFGTISHHGSQTRQGTAGAYTGHRSNFDWTGAALVAWVDGSNVGNVSLTSDYRAKRDIEPLPSMWERVKTLNPISYRHQDFGVVTGDDQERWGFVAHELQETLIEDAATGTKDQEDCIQSPNLMTVVATLTRALQEAMARIEALEATHG